MQIALSFYIESRPAYFQISKTEHLGNITFVDSTTSRTYTELHMCLQNCCSKSTLLH